MPAVFSAPKAIYLRSAPPKPGAICPISTYFQLPATGFALETHDNTFRKSAEDCLPCTVGSGIAAEIKCVEVKHTLHNRALNVWVCFASLKEAAVVERYGMCAQPENLSVLVGRIGKDRQRDAERGRSVLECKERHTST
jgi:hypothetical protein